MAALEDESRSHAITLRTDDRMKLPLIPDQFRRYWVSVTGARGDDKSIPILLAAGDIEGLCLFLEKDQVPWVFESTDGDFVVEMSLEGPDTNFATVWKGDYVLMRGSRVVVLKKDLAAFAAALRTELIESSRG